MKLIWVLSAMLVGMTVAAPTNMMEERELDERLVCLNVQQRINYFNIL
jgi:hypothetical protein